MDLKKPDPGIIKCWTIRRAIAFLFILLVTIGIWTAFHFLDAPPVVSGILRGGSALLLLYQLVSIFVFPKISYSRWGYLIDEEKVVIRHGLFWIEKTIIPIIRIQNVTMDQGPIMRKYDLFNVEMSLASGSFEIEGLSRETAESISQKLNERLLSRLRERGSEL